MKKKLSSILVGILCFVMVFAIGCSSDDNENTDTNNQVTNEQQEDTNNENTNNEDANNEDKDKDKDKEDQSIDDSDNQSSSIKTTEAEIHFINTGNSDSILVKQGGEAALIDGGNTDDDQKVVSYLKNHSVTKLKYIFATHPDADHIGGLDSVVKDFPVKSVFVSNGDAETKTYRDFIYAMADKGIGSSVPLLNSEFKLGTSTFKVISVANEKDVNNNSLVLLYTNGNDKVLLMGDAGREIESRLNPGDVDLIKVGHHGSDTSSSPDFIDRVSPEYAVITTGPNKYGHPSKATMDILKNRHIKVYRSDECGDIVFKSSGNGLSTNSSPGSYTPGSNSSSSSSSSSSSYSSSYSNSNDNSQSTDKSKTVYWTPSGECYHSTKSCPSLSRSKEIYSGTIEKSGKTRACSICD